MDTRIAHILRVLAFGMIVATTAFQCQGCTITRTGLCVVVLGAVLMLKDAQAFLMFKHLLGLLVIVRPYLARTWTVMMLSKIMLMLVDTRAWHLLTDKRLHWTRTRDSMVLVHSMLTRIFTFAFYMAYRFVGLVSASNIRKDAPAVFAVLFHLI